MSPFAQKATVKGVTFVRVVVKGLGPGRLVSRPLMLLSIIKACLHFLFTFLAIPLFSYFQSVQYRCSRWASVPCVATKNIRHSSFYCHSAFRK